MKRIFYFSGYRLTIFHWQNEKCITSYVFNPGQEGLEKFKTYLLATDNTPARLLIDLIEEDFKIENIPHVGATDRKSIVNRLIDRHYRKSKDYVNYNIIGRQKSGRKDDILLYSVLSNPEILDPWLKTIQQCNTAISGIWSLPLLSERLFTKIDNKANNALLVSQQVPSNLRQTFIKNGHFESSRSAVVNLEDATIGEFISSEVEQTIRYLSNQRFIGFDEKVQIHVICSKTDLAKIQSHCLDTAIHSFHYHSLNDIAEKFGFSKSTNKDSSKLTEYSNGIYSYICASKILPIGHYGNRSLFSRYYEQLLSKTLYASSAALLLFASIMSLNYFSESVTFDNQTATLKTQTRGVNNNYKKVLANLEPKLKKSRMMQSSVLLAEKIQQSKIISPQNFMVDISQILTGSGMQDMKITSISWQQYQGNTMSAENNNRNKSITDYAKLDKINQHAVIGGYIRVSRSSLKQSVDKLNSIIDAFKSNKLISTVKVNHMPVDIRSKSSIENESGSAQKNNSNSDKEKGKFEIEILMQSRES